MRTGKVFKVSDLPLCRNVPIGSQIRGDRCHRRDARELKYQRSEIRAIREWCMPPYRQGSAWLYAYLKEPASLRARQLPHRLQRPVPRIEGD
jgi:hypothetical protein